MVNKEQKKMTKIKTLIIKHIFYIKIVFPVKFSNSTEVDKMKIVLEDCVFVAFAA